MTYFSSLSFHDPERKRHTRINSVRITFRLYTYHQLGKPLLSFCPFARQQIIIYAAHTTLYCSRLVHLIALEHINRLVCQGHVRYIHIIECPCLVNYSAGTSGGMTLGLGIKGSRAQAPAVHH